MDSMKTGLGTSLSTKRLLNKKKAGAQCVLQQVRGQAINYLSSALDCASCCILASGAVDSSVTAYNTHQDSPSCFVVQIRLFE